MNRVKSFSFVIVAALGALYLTSLKATSQVNAKSVIMLQGATPGVSQSGHAHITGKLMAGGLEVFDPSTLGVRFTTNQITFANSNEDATYRYVSSPEAHQFLTSGSLRATINGNGIAGVGTGLTGLSATNISVGTLADARLSANIPRLNTANSFLNNMGIGGPANSNRLSVVGNAEISGSLDVGPITIPATARFYAVQALEFESTGQGSIRIHGTYLENSALTGTSFAAAPVHLPHGALLSQITVFVRDSASNDNMIVKLFEVDHASGVVTTVATLVPAFDSDVIESISTPGGNWVVNNDAKFYLVQVELPNTVSALELHTIRLKYTVSQPLP